MNKLKIISKKAESAKLTSDAISIIIKRVGKLSPILILVKEGINKVLRDITEGRTVLTTLSIEDLKKLDVAMGEVIKSIQKFEHR